MVEPTIIVYHAHCFDGHTLGGHIDSALNILNILTKMLVALCHWSSYISHDALTLLHMVT